MTSTATPAKSPVVPHFEFTPGARYWVGEIGGYLLPHQYEAVNPQFNAKPHLLGHFSQAVDVVTVPSSLHEGKSFQAFVWQPYAGKGSYATSGLDEVFIQTNFGIFCIMPEDEQKNIRDIIAKTIPKILNYPGGGYAVAPDCQPSVRNGKFYWGDKIRVATHDGVTTTEDSRVMDAIRNRIEAKSSKPINTKLSHRGVEILMVGTYENVPYTVTKAPANKSGYKSAITLKF